MDVTLIVIQKDVKNIGKLMFQFELNQKVKVHLNTKTIMGTVYRRSWEEDSSGAKERYTVKLTSGGFYTLNVKQIEKINEETK